MKGGVEIVAVALDRPEDRRVSLRQTGGNITLYYTMVRNREVLSVVPK